MKMKIADLPYSSNQTAVETMFSRDFTPKARANLLGSLTRSFYLHPPISMRLSSFPCCCFSALPFYKVEYLVLSSAPVRINIPWHSLGIVDER